LHPRGSSMMETTRKTRNRRQKLLRRLQI
jgi:hypothetical protein